MKNTAKSIGESDGIPMTIPKVFKVVDSGRGFASREKGRVVFERLRDILDGQPNQYSKAIVDWSGVRTASPSFIDEFIGLVCPEGESDSRWEGIVFTSIAPYIQDQMHAILRRRGCKIKYAPSLKEAREGPWVSLGEGVFRTACANKQGPS